MSAQLKKIKFDRRGRHVLGTKLGEGAQGFIYSLKKENGEDSEWCAKITAIAKATKSRQSVREIIPRLPKPSGDTKTLEAYKNDAEAGYLFIVMERMEMTLIEAVKTLPVASNSVDLSAVAQRMLYICKTFHDAYKLITDVKADNFMVAKGEGSVAERLRMVDLALLKDIMDSNGKHGANEGMTSLRGTPLYASINAHELQTISRRDDIESLLYLLAELVIVVYATHTDPKALWYKSGSFLPWSNGKSDADIFQQKKQNLTNKSSEFYNRMPSDMASLFQELWDECRRCEYATKPNYDLFEKKLGQLVVRLPVQKRKSAQQSPAGATRSSPRRRMSSVRDPVPSDERAADPMEVDEVWNATENVDPQGSNAPTLMEDRRYEAATLTAIEGPHKGEKWVVQEGAQERYCIGSKPSKKGHLPLALSKDKSVLANHAHIKLSLSKKKLLIQIWDLSKGNTKINGTVKATADFALFDGNKVQMGDTVLQVSRAPRPTLK
ncbi:hypothetical protein FisN_5Hh094 [Fistulifera solaris]|uniref:Casein kinase I n=1 Tax=Fistulifera solaris TaxID=1519565 RepID=A0A1Z5JUA0_FISSO|nr:hypothetical protein FisN_5Hh094 [Fistulifera solaris]|eukprot:GAX17446.1 hypothetical protein FisN_5Hh094 [Fistulifera solaris]